MLPALDVLRSLCEERVESPLIFVFSWMTASDSKPEPELQYLSKSWSLELLS